MTVFCKLGATWTLRNSDTTNACSRRAAPNKILGAGRHLFTPAPHFRHPCRRPALPPPLCLSSSLRAVFEIGLCRGSGIHFVFFCFPEDHKPLLLSQIFADKDCISSFFFDGFFSVSAALRKHVRVKHLQRQFPTIPHNADKTEKKTHQAKMNEQGGRSWMVSGWR